MVINMECLAALRTMPSNSVDAVITDPPYQIDNTTAGGRNKSPLAKSIQGMNDEIVDAGIVSGFDPAVLDELVRVCKRINMYFFCNKAQIPMYLDYFVTGKKCSFDILKWVKTNTPPTYHGKMLSDTEYCLLFRKGARCMPGSYADASTLYMSPMNVADKKKYGHPTPKPVLFLRRLVRNCSKPGDVILDPFYGSGAVGEACIIEGRTPLGIELVQKHADTARAREEAAKCKST